MTKPSRYCSRIRKVATSCEFVDIKTPCENTHIAVAKVKKTNDIDDLFLLPIRITASRLLISIAVIHINAAYSDISTSSL